MGLCKVVTRLFLVSSLTCGTLAYSVDTSSTERNRILYLLQIGREANALDLYDYYHQQTGRHDGELLQKIALQIIEQGFKSKNPEEQVLAIFGAGISANENALHILEDAVSSPIPQIQMLSLAFLSRLHHDDADEALNIAMKSNYLLVRAEAVFHLAEKKHPKAVGQIESLMNKVDPELLPAFPQLFALTGTPDATRMLKKLLNHSSEKVRVSAILSVAKYDRDDLLPQVRTLLTHHSVPQQEACCLAIGLLKDEASLAKVELLTQSRSTNVRLAALQALYRLGRKEVYRDVEQIAKMDDLFAIAILADMEESAPVLVELTKSSSLQVKVNAALALLKLKDPRCLLPLVDVLIQDSRDLGFVEITTAGNGLKAWKIVPSAHQNFGEDPMSHEMSLALKENTLAQIVNLPEEYFYVVAKGIFQQQQNALIPTLVDLLEAMQTPEAIALLKTYQQQAGAPLIRNYCNLALCRMKEEGPYKENLRTWIRSQQNVDMIQFRPFVPWELRDHASRYQLTPHDTSRLLVEAFETLARQQDEEGISILLQAIRFGNSKNKYALAGLLMHATQ